MASLTRPGEVLPPQAIMMQMVTGYFVSHVVGSLASYGIPDLIASGRRSTESIAQAIGGNVEAVSRLLRAAKSLGILTMEPDGWGITPLGATLQTSSPGSARGLAIALTSPGHVLPWLNIKEAVQTGQTSTAKALGGDIWKYYATHPEEERYFSNAMSDVTYSVAPAVAQTVASLGMPSLPIIADVGGALGMLLQVVMAAVPTCQGILFDREPVIADAKTHYPETLKPRTQFVAGNFFEAVPSADIMMLKFILHDWNDAECVQILTACANSLRPGGRVVVVELLVDAEPTPQQTMMDLNMLVMTGGKERTLQEFGVLFQKAGLVLETHVPTPTQMYCIIARKA